MSLSRPLLGTTDGRVTRGVVANTNDGNLHVILQVMADGKLELQSCGEYKKRIVDRSAVTLLPPLRPISLLQACERLGWVLDMMKDDPNEVLRVFRVSASHPLRGLFLPVEAQPSRDTTTTSYGALIAARGGVMELTATASLAILLPLLMPQAYVRLLMKDPCSNTAPNQVHAGCTVHAFLMPGGALFVTGVCCAVWKLACLAAAVAYATMESSRPVWARAALKFATASVKDRLAVDVLNAIFGAPERYLLHAFAGALLAFAVFSTALRDPSAFLFGKLALTSYLVVVNGAIGEASGNQHLREQEIAARASDLARDGNLDVESFTFKFLHVLKHHPVHDTIVVDVGVLAAVAAAVQVPTATSTRLRHIIVKHAYWGFNGADVHFATQQDVEEFLPEDPIRKDVAVDLFEGTAEVLGGAHPGNRWARIRKPVCWQTCVQTGALVQTNIRLRTLGVCVGSCAFTPGPKQGYFAIWEREEGKASLDATKKAIEETKTRQALLQTALLVTDNVQHTEMLLRAGASPNNQYGNHECAVFSALKDSREGPAIAKLLLDFKANPEARFVNGQSPLERLHSYGELQTAKVIEEEIERRKKIL